MPRPHFHEDQIPALTGNDVDLTQLAGEIPLHNPVPAGRKILRGHVFRGLALLPRGRSISVLSQPSHADSL